MDKKIKFSEQPMKVKIIYGAVVAILCVTAIVIGIVSVASKKDKTPSDSTTPPVTDGNNSNENENTTPEDEGDKTPAKLTFTAPVVGEIAKAHSADTPVFSNTLGDWRIHTGIDISADEGSAVYAAADGVVSKVYSDHFLGKSVEITHAGGIVSVYSNLSGEGICVSVGDEVKAGAKIGVVGDTSLTELADEPHIHFEMKVNGVSVNPLDYISEDSKKASLGIDSV